MSYIPLLLNHAASKVIGVWQPGGVARFNDDQRITREQLFEMFGGAGILVREFDDEGGVMYVRAFEILEFSLVTDAIPAVTLNRRSTLPDVAELSPLDLMRTAIADYIRSEGCSCCQDRDAHQESRARIGNLLGLKPDEEGWHDFAPYRTATGLDGKIVTVNGVNGIADGTYKLKRGRR